MLKEVVCPTCAEQALLVQGLAVPELIWGELDQVGFVRVKCKNQHSGVVIYDVRRYLVLVESAASAYVDNYTNEVVSVMSAALERAYEFYIRVSCRAKGIPVDQIDDAWSGVNSASERQLGAFQFLYLIDQGVAFKIDRKIAETRNRIIHKGHIASSDEALDFAEKVFERISHIEVTLKSCFQEACIEQAKYEVDLQRKKIDEGVPTLVMRATTVQIIPGTNEVAGSAQRFIEIAGEIAKRRIANM